MKLNLTAQTIGSIEKVEVNGPQLQYGSQELDKRTKTEEKAQIKVDD